MFTVDKLKEFGCNVEEGLARCINNEAFYLRLVSSLVPEAKVGELKEALTNNDLQKAFEITHALKGVYGNLAITPLYNKVSEMCELLRNKTEMDYLPLYLEFEKLYNEFAELAN